MKVCGRFSGKSSKRFFLFLFFSFLNNGTLYCLEDFILILILLLIYIIHNYKYCIHNTYFLVGMFFLVSFTMNLPFVSVQIVNFITHLQSIDNAVYVKKLWIMRTTCDNNNFETLCVLKSGLIFVDS